MAKWWKKTEKKQVKYNPPAAHSILLALEPRQVFDGALGAAIAEVMADPNIDNHDTADNQGFIREEGGGADQITARGDQRDNGLEVTVRQAESLAPVFDLSLITVSGDSGGEPLTLVLQAEGGTFIVGGDIRGVEVDADGRTLTLSGLSAAEINQALESCLFMRDSLSGGGVSLTYSLSADGAETANGALEAGADQLTEPAAPNRALAAFSDVFAPLAANTTDTKDGVTVTIDPGTLPGRIGNGNSSILRGISVDGQDGEMLTLTIEAKNGEVLEGTFKYADHTFDLVIDDSEKGRITITGTAAEINKLLGASGSGQDNSILSYASSGDAPHQVDLSFSLEKAAAAGGSAAVVGHRVTINHPPSITIGKDFTGTVKENSEAAKPGQNQTDGREYYFVGIEISDANKDKDTLTVTLELTGGTVTGKLNGEHIPADLSDKYTLTDGKLTITTASAAEVKQILDNLYFKGDPNQHGDVQVTITAQDSLGETVNETKTITVTFVNDPPLVEPPAMEDTGKHAAVSQGGVTQLDGTHFNIRDALDAGSDEAKDSEITITLTDPPDQGQLYIYPKGSWDADGHLLPGAKGIMLGAGATFSLDDVKTGRIWYQHDAAHDVDRQDVLPGTSVNDLPMDSFSFSVNDGSGPVNGHRYRDEDGKLVENDNPLLVYINLNPINKGFEVGTGLEPVEGDDYHDLWVWEDQQGAWLGQSATENDSRDKDHVMPGKGIWLKVGDDELADFKITVNFDDFDYFSEYGVLYYMKDGVRVELGAGDSFNGQYLSALRFDYKLGPDNAPDHGKYPTFSLTFEDHQGEAYTGDPASRPAAKGYSFADDGVISDTYFFRLKIADNNDDPVLSGSLTAGTEAKPIIIDTTGGHVEVFNQKDRFVVIDWQTMLSTEDEDSVTTARTYTVTGWDPSDRGVHLVRKGAHGEYYELGEGDTFSHAEVMSGKIGFYINSGDATKPVSINENFTFTVTDGALNSWPDQGRPGGIYDYQSDENGKYTLKDGQLVYADHTTLAEDRYSIIKVGVKEWQLKDFTFNLNAVIYAAPGEGGFETVKNVPPVLADGTIDLIFEGHEGDPGHKSEITLWGGTMKPNESNSGELKQIDDNEKTFDPWPNTAKPADENVVLYLYDPDTDPKYITVSLDCHLQGGRLLVDYGDGFREIQYGGKFTYEMMMNGQVKYVHDGGEVFQETIKFKVADASGPEHATSAELVMKITPYNDAPNIEAPESVVVDEGKTVYFNGGDDNIQTVIITDPDGVDVVGQPTYNADGKLISGNLQGDEVEVKFVETPRYGDLYYYDASKVTAECDGWIIIAKNDLVSRELLEAGFKYEHRGDEDFDPVHGHNKDSFTMVAVDTPESLDGVQVPGGAESKPETVEINIKAINNPPKLDGTTSNATATESKVDDKGKVSAIPITIDDSNINFKDQDHDKENIFFYITAGCKAGQLYYDNGEGVRKPLNENSTFTQADLDAGFIKYEHDGSNRHEDGFTFKVTDGSKYYIEDTGGNEAEVFAGDPNNATPVDFKIIITPINEAPVFTGMGTGSSSQAEVWYEDSTAGIRFVDESKAGDYLQISDKDFDRNFDVTPAPGSISQMNDEMRLTITVSENNWTNATAGYNTGGTAAAFQGYFSFDGSYTGSFTDSDLTVDGNGSLTLTGTLAELNQALEFLIFKSSDDGADLNTTLYFTFKINDLNNGGANPGQDRGDGDQPLEAFRYMRVYSSITNTAPGTATKNPDGSDRLPPPHDLKAWEDIQVKVFGDPSTCLQFADVDAFNRNTNTITITVPNGQGTVAYKGGTSGLVQSGNNTDTLVLKGTLDQLNKALNEIYYTSPENQSGTTSIKFTYCDEGNTGRDGGILSTEFDVSVTVNAVNDTPTVDIADSDDVQIIDDQEYNTYEITNGSPIPDGSYHELKLDGLITIGDAGDQVKGFNDPDNPNEDISGKDVKVTLKASDFSKGTQVGIFKPTEGAGSNWWDDFETDYNVTITEDSVTGAITIIGKLDDVQTAINNISYAVHKDKVGVDDQTMARLTVIIDDGYNGYKVTGPDLEAVKDQSGHSEQNSPTAQAEFVVNISGVNAPPSITGKSEITIHEDLLLEKGQDNYDAGYGINLNDNFTDEATNPNGLHVDDTGAFEHKVLYEIKLSDNNAGKLYLNEALYGFPKGEVDLNTLRAYFDNATDPTAWKEAGLTLTQLNDLIDHIYFKPADNWNGAVFLQITVNDKGKTGTVPNPLPSGWTETNGGLETVKQFKITVKPTNDAPTLTGAGNVSVAAVDEKSKDHSGQTINDLLSGRFQDTLDSTDKGLTDHQGAFKGVFIVGDSSTEAQGTWQYWDQLANSGAGKWTDIDLPDDGQALYLDKGTNIRFLPAGDFYGTPGQLTVHLVETMPVAEPYTGSDYADMYGHLTTGDSIKLSDDLMDADYRPYTKNTVDIVTQVRPKNDDPAWGLTPDGTIVEKPGGYQAETNEDTGLTLNGLTFNDPDVRTGSDDQRSYSLKLTVEHGQLTPKAGYQPPAGVSISGDGTAGSPLIVTGASQAQLQALLDGNLVYNPTRDYYGPDKLTITVNDGGNAGKPDYEGAPVKDGAGNDVTTEVTITVKPVNDAPTLDDTAPNFSAKDGSGNHTLKDPFRDNNGDPAILEDQTANLPAKTVNEIFGGSYDDNIDKRNGGHDPDVEKQHTFAGVVIFGNSSDRDVDGVWEYYDTSDGQWVTISNSLSASSGLYLDKATEIRFVPNENFNGNTGQLKAYLADSTIAAGLVTGSGVNVTDSKRGQTTPFSVNHLAVGTVVKAVNDAPKWTAAAPDDAVVGTVKAPEDGFGNNAGQKVGDLIKDAHFDDSDDKITNGSSSNNLAGILITKVDAPEKDSGGHWEYSADGGATWSTIDPTEISGTSGLYLKITDSIRYVPEGKPSAETDYYGPVYDNSTSLHGLHVHLVDDSDPSLSSGRVDLSGSGLGGSTPFSEAARVITAEITPINDAPVLDPNTTITKEVGCNDPADVSKDQLTWTIDDIIGDKFSDSIDNDASQFQGIIITGIDVDNVSGTDLVWKYSTNNGLSWTAISGGTPFYLPKDAQLRLCDRADGGYPDPGSNGVVEAYFTYRVVETDGSNNPEDFASPGLDDPANYGQQINGFNPDAETGGATRISAETGRVEVFYSKKEYAPTIDVPPDFKFVAQEDTPMYVGGFTIGDGNNDTLTVTIKAENGVLSFKEPVTGVTVVSGNETGAITLTGKFADLNKALNPNDPADGQKLTFLNQETHYNGPAKITVTVDDGHKGSSGGNDGHGQEQASEVFEFKVVPVNDAPTILDLKGNGQKVDQLNVEISTCDDAAEVNEKTTHTVADLVRDWFSDPQDKLFDELSGQSGSYETDKLEGIIITATNGTDNINWQYSLDNGGTWVTVSPASGQGLYLPAEALLRLDPQAGLDHEATPSFSCLLVETEVKTYDSGDNIGEPILDNGQLQYLEYGDHLPGELFALNTLATADTTRVSDINDPLTIKVAIRDPRPGFECNDPALKMTEDNELTIDNIKVSHWDGDNSTVVVAISPGDGYKGGFNCLPPTGCGVTVSTGPGGELILTGTAKAINDFIDDGQVRLAPTRDAHSAENCKITVSASYYSTQDAADYSSSTNVEYILTEFIKVNDAPETTDDQTWLPDFTNRPGAEPESQTVADLFGPLFSDARDQQDGCSGNSLRGVLITGSLADPAKEGLWQYFDGSGWVDISVTGAAGALYLEAGTELRFLPVTGYSGQPGGLTVLLVETETTSVTDPADPRHTTGLSTAARPADFVTGEFYDYGGQFSGGGDSRVSLEAISLDIKILPYANTDPVSPPILTENPSETWRDNNSPTTPGIPPWKRTDEIDDFSTNYERNGLDAPHLRRGGSAGDGHQELNLITNTYVGSVCWHITEHINASISRADQFLAGAEPVAFRPSPSDSGLAALNYQWSQSADGLPSLILSVDDFAGHLGASPVLFSASLADGGELPEWLIFNSASLTFQITDPTRLTEPISLLVTAKDEEGRRIALTFELAPGGLPGVEEAAETEATEGETADPAGDMISQRLEPGLDLTEAAESFRDLWAWPESLPDRAEAGPHDADLNQKMELCAVDALLLKAQKMLSVLSS